MLLDDGDQQAIARAEALLEILIAAISSRSAVGALRNINLSGFATA